MSWQSAEEPEAKTPTGCKALKTVIVPRPRDIGGFEVRRVLPSSERRSVRPFLRFDQMDYAELAPGTGIDVQPHPHIGLATVTYLFAGFDRSSRQSGQRADYRARRGQLDDRWARHRSLERSDTELRKRRQELYGIQIWVALLNGTRKWIPTSRITPPHHCL